MENVDGEKKLEENNVSGLISIIVPIYNVRGYLNKCIDSIIEQTYSRLQIILVDDGSTDGSGEICDEYLKKDNRIQVFHKKNGGASSARNFGLKKAKGEWIGFVDSDDYVEQDMYELLLLNMDSDVDITCCARKVIYPPEQRKRPEFWCALNKRKVFSSEEAVKEVLMLRYLSFSVCTKLFRKSLLKDMWFPFGKTAEDIPFTYEALKRSRSVVHIGKAKYINFHRENSSSRRPFYMGRINSVQFSRSILLDVIKEYPELRKDAEVMYTKSIYNMIINIEKGNETKEYISLLNKLKKELVRMYIRNIRNPYMPEYLKEYAISICFTKRFK